jgi:hypothetical protein
MRKLFAIAMALLGLASGVLIFADAAGMYTIARPLSLWLLFITCSSLAVAGFYPSSPSS